MYRFFMSILVLTATSLSAGLTAAQGQEASVRRVLAFGDSNTWGWAATENGIPTQRLPFDERWTGRLAATLGDSFVVIENGLNLRTTDLDDPTGGGGQLTPQDYNGIATLPGVLAANAPLDHVIIALGQNDLQAQYNRSPNEIAASIGSLVATVRRSAGEIGTTYPAPDVIVLAPIPLGKSLHPDFTDGWRGAQTKSQGLAAAIQSEGARAGFTVIDVSAETRPIEGIDGLHFSVRQHSVIADTLAAYFAHALAETASPNTITE